MDEMLERLNRIYPNSGFVEIPAYDPKRWEGREYNSHEDQKAAVNKWKSNPYDINVARKLVEMGRRIGWIIPEGFVCVDIDNTDDDRTQEYIENILKKFEVSYNYNYTSRGIHLIFSDSTKEIKTEAHMKCALNLTVDTRANGNGYIVLPCNDPHREWGKWSDFVEEIPYFLRPIMKNDTPSFIGMVDGDGRNDALWKWTNLLLSTHKLSKEEIEKSIRTINEYLFETGIPNKELYQTVLRDRTPKEIGVLDKQLKQRRISTGEYCNTIAEDFVTRFDIISYGQNIYRFNGTYYKRIETLELERMIHFDVDKTLASNVRTEIIKFILLKTQVRSEDFDKDWYKIACGNGILNLVTGEVTIPTKNDINTIYIPWNYNEDPPYSPRIDEFMKQLTNGDMLKMEFLYQVAGYCLLKKNYFEKFFVFRGEGGTGKSTYMNLIQKMVGGDRNCSHIGLDQFDKDYYISLTISKLVNIDDDVVDNKTMAGTGKFKSFVSGNPISVRQIYKEPIDYTPYATCMFSCNKLPKIMDSTSGMYRRIILIELNTHVEHPDPLFMTKITTLDMEYFLYKAVQGIIKAIEEGHFRITMSEKRLMSLFKRRQSAIVEWILDNNVTMGDIHNVRCRPLFQQFMEWCAQSNITSKVSAFQFKEEICALYDVSVEFENNVTGEVTPSSIRQQVFVKYGIFDKDALPSGI